MIEHNGAEVLVPYFVYKGVGSVPGTNNPWPIYINFLADQPNEALVIFDTTGSVDGRDMRTGELLEKPGIQVMIRAMTNRNGVSKGRKIIQAIEQLYKFSVTLTQPTKQYVIHSLQRTSPVYPLGQEEGGSRLLYTINGLLTFGEQE
jgi:hypothetical protein